MINDAFILTPPHIIQQLVVEEQINPPPLPHFYTSHIIQRYISDSFDINDPHTPLSWLPSQGYPAEPASANAFYCIKLAHGFVHVSGAMS